MYLFLDTETTGLPIDWNASVSDLNNWPRVVQVAWTCYDAKGRHVVTKSFIVKPDGFSIPREAQQVHGISTAKALARGRPLRTVLKALAADLGEARVVIAHNLQFDENVIGAEFLRQSLKIPFQGKKRLCTMVESTEYCCLPRRYGYKWPTLAELHEVLFGESPPEGHDAEVDATTCAKCFFELKRRRVIRVRLNQGVRLR
jgi:DNA polymerase III epsilon subunit-like protein